MSKIKAFFMGFFLVILSELYIVVPIHAAELKDIQQGLKEYKNIENLTVAPDTHVIKSTHKLGLITDEELNKNDVQLIVIDRWNELFKNTKYKPIDIHTALWLWSRNGFKDLDESILNN